MQKIAPSSFADGKYVRELLDMCEGNSGTVYQTETYCAIGGPGNYDISVEGVKVMDEFIKSIELVKFE